MLPDIRPQIWRRFKVPAGISFHTLHNIIQVVMGWENYHLYRFVFDFEAFTEQPLGAEDRSSSTMIDPYLQKVGLQFFYEYDFGDSWGHVLILEKFLVREVAMPQCVAGKRACPLKIVAGLGFMMIFYAHDARAKDESRKNGSIVWEPTGMLMPSILILPTKNSNLNGTLCIRLTTIGVKYLGDPIWNTPVMRSLLALKVPPFLRAKKMRDSNRSNFSG